MHLVGVDAVGNQRCWWCGELEDVRVYGTRERVILGPRPTSYPTGASCAHCDGFARVTRSA